MSALRPAALDEYLTWLRAWLSTGHQPTHYYDYPWARWTWLTAERDFTTGNERGAGAVRIIVPAGLRHVGGELGHNELYLHDGPGHRGGVVPVFADLAFLALPGVPEFVERKRVEGAAFRKRMEAADRERRVQAVGSDVTRWSAAAAPSPDPDDAPSDPV